MIAFYFSNKDKKLRHGDDRQIRNGRAHKVSCDPILCRQGLHASELLIDALKYAPGEYLWLVDLKGEIKIGDDKLVATKREYIDGFDATDILREFARKTALVNIEKIYKHCSKKDYDLIVEYLETGNTDIQSAAWSAESAAWSAESAARSAAWSAESAARSAARAAWSAESAESAAWSAERSGLNKLLTDLVRAKTGWDI